MVITEEQKSKLLSLSLVETVSFEKGDTVFVDKACQMLTTPLKAYLKTFGAKQVYDEYKAKYVIIRRFIPSIQERWNFGGGTWFNKNYGTYELRAPEKVWSWRRNELLEKMENHFGYIWDEFVIDATTNSSCINAEFCLSSNAILLSEDSIQSLVYQWQKDNIWTKISATNVDKLTSLLESQDMCNVDLAVKMINRFDPTDVMARLILLYYSYSTTVYAKNRLRDKVFKKDPDLYKLIGKESQYSIGKRELPRHFRYKLVENILSKYVSDDDVSSFLS